MLIKVAICEDEKVFRDTLEIILKYYLKEKNKSYILDCYERGEQLLESNHNQYNILFLDVEIKNGIDGIELAKRLRIENNTGEIIFLTSHQEEAYKAFEVNAFRYLLKPLQEDMLYKTMDLAIEKIEEIKKNYIILESGTSIIKLQLKDIIYIETYERKLKVHTLEKEYVIDYRLRDIEDKLRDKWFFRVHKSFLINLEHIKEHNDTNIIMQNGVVIYISRLKLQPFKQLFVGYLRG